MSNQKSPFDSSKHDIARDFNAQPLSDHQDEYKLNNDSSELPSVEEAHPFGAPALPTSTIQPFLHLPSRSTTEHPSLQTGFRHFQLQSSPLPQMPVQAQPKPPVLPPPPMPAQRRTRRRALNPWLAAAFIILTLLIVAGSILERDLWMPGTPQSQTNNAIQASGFVQVPLSSQQIDNLRHITAHMSDKQLAYLDVQSMSLDEEIGQIMMVAYQENTYSKSLDTMIHNLHAGSVILFQNQIRSKAQTKADTASMQKSADLPLLISTDEEGGLVQRLSTVYPSRPSAYQIGLSNSTAFAAAQGTQAARDLLSLGINTNLAPDVDVSANNGYIGSQQRSFGDTAAKVLQYAGPYIKAMQAGGAIATLKHFPGLGGASAAANPHEVFVTVKHTTEQVNTVDLAPFKQFINTSDTMEQPGLIMATDELVPSIDPTYIAELSPTFITKILRQQLGYQGVAITDDLTMLGVQVHGKHIELAQAGVMALQAGEDILLGAYSVASMEAMIQAIKDALNNGTLTKSRLDEAATRVLTLKMQRNLIPSTVIK
jgi:beta-N-acetylhexosaminidase